MLKKGFRLNIPAAALNANASNSNTELRPFVSPAYEDVPIWNILPSYQLYELTFCKNVDTEAEDFPYEPPTYEIASPSGSDHESGSYFPHTAVPMSSTGSVSSSNSSAEELAEPQPLPGRPPPLTRGPSFSTWENSILANAHRLARLGDFDRLRADKIQVQIFFTATPGSCSREPTSYDPLNKEFLQGDSIHGYVLLENLNPKPVPFDMFLVVFEGRVSVNIVESDSKLKPVVFYKFLNMFDYSASWTPAYFDRVDNKIDPRDGTHLQFSVKALEPGVKYKRFFNFTVPDCLLDCACESHQIPSHCQLLPTLGLDRMTFLQRLRQQRDGHLTPKKSGHSPGPYMHPSENSSSEHVSRKPPMTPLVRDFSFPDTSINYCVETRLVAKRSAYQNAGLPGSDEFIIVKEAGSSLRVVPKEMNFVQDDDTLMERRFESFCSTVERIISRGHKLDNGLSIAPTRRSSTAKQVYGDKGLFNTPSSNNFEVLMPYKKKSLTQNPKVVGMVRALFSREEKILLYKSPVKFASVSSSSNKNKTQFILPISMEYKCKEDPRNSRPPEIKGVSAKIVACTVRSNKYPIPVELSQKMKFNNSLMLKDEFEKNVVEKFQKYLQELSKLIAKHGHTKLDIDQQLMMDVKCLANLHVKNDCLKISAEYTGGLPKWSNYDQSETCHNLFKVLVDISSLAAKDTSKQLPENMRGSLGLVPSFESCIVARFYYALIELKMGNGDVLPLKVPVKIQH